MHVDDVTVEVWAFGLTASATASGFTQFGGGSNLTDCLSYLLLSSTAIYTVPVPPGKEK